MSPSPLMPQRKSNRMSIRAGEIRCGVPLMFDIVGANGRVIKTRGEIVVTENEMTRLMTSGFKIPAEDTAGKPSPFERMEPLATRLAALFSDLEHGQPQADWAARMRSLTADLLRIADDSPDATFAYAHAGCNRPYTVIHPLMAALVAARLAKAIALDEATRFSLTAGALTHDLILMLRRSEVDAARDLAAEAKSIIRGHAASGVALLEKVGISDSVWLTVVRDHHEFLDGSGYRGAFGKALGIPARIMALADAFSAMLRPRPYRGKRLAKNALAELYADPSGRYDKSILAVLIRELGMYPPGTLLRLASGETAIAVRSRRESIQQPEIYAVIDAGGNPIDPPSARDSGSKQSRIEAVLDPETVKHLRGLLQKCWPE